MKSVLCSINPRACQLIASGKQTVLVTKTVPNNLVSFEDFEAFKVYIYCMKARRGNLIMAKSDEMSLLFGRNSIVAVNGGCAKDEDISLFGKVIGEFVCEWVHEFKVFENGTVQDWNFANLQNSHLPYDELAEFIGRGKYGYALRISQLKIYDKPKNLNEFHEPCSDMNNCLNVAFRTAGRSLDKCFDCGCGIKRPPRYWCCVEPLSQ